MIKVRNQNPQVPLRVGVGLLLAGYSFPLVFTRGGHADFAHMLSSVGLPAPDLSAWGVGLLELVGGLALVAGAFVEVVAAVLALEMLVRVVVIWLEGKGFPQPLPNEPALPGYEMNLMYIGCLAALVSAGAGRFAVDQWLARQVRGAPPKKGVTDGRKVE